MLIMERSEPALIPEWLKTSGNVIGGGNANHHAASASFQSDNHVANNSTRNRPFKSTNGYDSPRSVTLLDRKSSAYFGRSSSSNASFTHEKEALGYSRSHSTSARSHCDRDRDKDYPSYSSKDRSVLDEDRNYTRSATSDRCPKAYAVDDIMKRGESWPKQLLVDVNSGNKSNSNSSGSVVRGSPNGSTKTVFEKDFPSLGSDERRGASDIARISSPSLSSAAHNLPIGSSAMIGGDGWTSALAEVPVVIGSMGLSSVQQSSTASVAPSTTSSLNMAATLVLAPPRVHTAPQLSAETQRLEELAIKQSRQLIPMTPSMPKTMVLNSEKSKPRATARSETRLASKIGNQNQLSSHVLNQPAGVGNARSDMAKSSQFGKLLVLKPVRENNGNTISTKSSMSPTSAGAGTSNLLAQASSPTSASQRLNNSNLLTPVERKSSALPTNCSSQAEKRPILSRLRSRNEFFNLMRKKTSTIVPSGSSDQSPALSTTIPEQNGESTNQSADKFLSQINYDSSNPSFGDWSSETNISFTGNSNSHKEPQTCPDNGNEDSVAADVNEEEIAFLRSLGWEENAEEEEGLTEEEIHAFFKELHPATKLCQGFQREKLLSLLKSHVGNAEIASSAFNSSDIETSFVGVYSISFGGILAAFLRNRERLLNSFVRGSILAAALGRQEFDRVD
ncbi:hypothetical protein Syun_003067 [Stephania yunnanensis]|uniref:Uncharacterized protein n=1 Tax=Stephania yunnanensis TaxID=152371 RepID=A0AAP0L331_9MAGN